MQIKNHFIKEKVSATALILLDLNYSMAAEIAPQSHNNLINNGLFWILLTVIILLLFFIASVSQVIKNITELGVETKQSTAPNKSLITLFAIAVYSFIDINFSYGKDVVETVTSVGNDFFRAEYEGLNADLFYIMITAIMLEVFILFILLMVLSKMLHNIGLLDKTETKEKSLFNFAKISAGLIDSVPIERETEIMTNHEYDGIRELDNNLPPWWKYGFYLTIVISIIYLFNYHIIRSSPLQSAEYLIEVEQAAIDKEAYLKTVADRVDESNVVALLTSNDINAGANLFQANCVACHGKYGEGTVGPNLTDNYWLHGGGIKSIFKTIKYGVPAKGMIAWQAQFKPGEMQQLASFIISLQGSNPAGAKAAQGDLYINSINAEKSAINDSTAHDSAATAEPKVTPY